MKLLDGIGKLLHSYPAIMVGLLAGGALVSAAEYSLVPAILQAVCAGAMACMIATSADTKPPEKQS